MTTVFREWMHRSIDLGPSLPPPRRDEQRALVDAIAPTLLRADPWTSVAEAIHGVLASRGWAWNGFYMRHQPDQLLLVGACGPPVCATLDRTGDVGSSGMCWDAILMNQTVVATDVAQWPGYVSCDGESGLGTVAGLVCPVRDERGRPVGVWDLDSTRPLEPEDGPFMDRLFATLSAVHPPDPQGG